MIRLLVGVLVFVINTVYPRSTYSPILCTGNCGAGALFFLPIRTPLLRNTGIVAEI